MAEQGGEQAVAAREPQAEEESMSASQEATPSVLYRVSSSGSMSHLAPTTSVALDALSLLDEVAGGGSPAALASLKEVLLSSPGAQQAATQQVVAALVASASVSRQVQGCRMVRAMCLAGGLPHLEAVEVPARLLQALTTPAQDARLLTPSAEALVSCALRGQGVAQALVALPKEQLQRLVQHLMPVPAAAAEQQPASWEQVQLAQAVLRLVSSIVTHPGVLPALVNHATLLPALVQALPRPSNQPPPPPAPARNPPASTSPTAAPSSPAINAAATSAATSSPPGASADAADPPTTTTPASTSTDITSPPTIRPPAPTSSSTSISTSSLSAAPASASTSSRTGTSSSSSSSQPPATRTPAQVKAATASFHSNALNMVLYLSQFQQMHVHLAHQGVAQQLVPLLALAAPTAVSEPAIAAVSNLAHGSPSSQQALVVAGAMPALVSLLPSRHPAVLTGALDAIANLMINNPTAQRQLSAATCIWPGPPALLGRAQVTAGAAAAAAAAGGGSAARPPVGPLKLTGMASLVRLLRGPAALMVVAKALRALGNAVLSCPANQAALLATGFLPALLQLSTCGVPQVARQAVGALTNLLPGCDAAQQAALQAGLPAVCSQLLSRRFRQQQPAAGTATTTNDSPAPTADMVDSSEGGASLPGTTSSSSSTAAEPQDQQGTSNSAQLDTPLVTTGSSCDATDAMPQTSPLNADAPPAGDAAVASSPPSAPDDVLHQGSPSASAEESTQATAAAPGPLVCDELMERSCLLVANLATAGRPAKALLVQAGVPELLMELLRQGLMEVDVMQPGTTEPAEDAAPVSDDQGAPPTSDSLATSSSQPAPSPLDGDRPSTQRGGEDAGPGPGSEAQQAGSRTPAAVVVSPAEVQRYLALRSRTVAAAAGALSNLSLNSNDVAGQVVRLGALPLLLELVDKQGQTPEVLSRATHALGSILLHCPATKQPFLDAQAPSRLKELIQDPSSTAPVRAACCRALGHLALGSTAAQSALAKLDVVPALVTAMQDKFQEVVSASLNALASVTQGCTPAQLQFLSVPGAPEALVKAANNPASLVLVCACVHALTCPPPRSAASKQAMAAADGAGAGGVLEASFTLSGGGGLAQESGRAAVHQMQEALAQAGMVPMLVWLLKSHRAQVVDVAAMALCSMLSGNRDCQTRVAACGGVLALTTLMERLGGQHEQRSTLTRHVVDAWLELGGATAAVKLLGHAQPGVVECACRRIAAGVLALAGRGPRGAGAGAGAGGADGKAGAAGQVEVEAASGSWLLGAAGAAAAAGPSEEAAAAATAALVKAGAPAALVNACNRTGVQSRVLAAVLVALRSLLEVGGAAVRALLLQAGATTALQSLQQGLGAEGDAAWVVGSKQPPPAATKAAGVVGGAGEPWKAGAGKAGPGSRAAPPGRRAGAVPGGAGAAMQEPQQQQGVKGKVAATGAPAASMKPTKANYSGVGMASRPGEHAAITPLHVAQLAEQLCMQLLM